MTLMRPAVPDVPKTMAGIHRVVQQVDHLVEAPRRVLVVGGVLPHGQVYADRYGKCPLNRSRSRSQRLIMLPTHLPSVIVVQGLCSAPGRPR